MCEYSSQDGFANDWHFVHLGSRAARGAALCSQKPRQWCRNCGRGALFLSLGPGAVGQSGCQLAAKVRIPTAGVSDAFLLGRVIDLPLIDKFTLADEKLGDSLYAGTLTGKNLQMVEKTGWDAKTGYAVQGIATPVPGTPGEQTLKIALPWPSPSPRAPLYVWLRGETEARLTQARY